MLPRMVRPQKLLPAELETWLSAHPGWTREGEGLVRTFRFDDFAAALAFTVRLGMIGEKRDHHPDILVGWGKARVLWTTHDAGGVTSLDLALAEATDGISTP